MDVSLEAPLADPIEKKNIAIKIMLDSVDFHAYVMIIAINVIAVSERSER